MPGWCISASTSTPAPTCAAGTTSSPPGPPCSAAYACPPSAAGIDRTTGRRIPMETLFVPISLLAGGLLAVQAGANAQLAKATGSPFAATTLQLSVGTAILLAAALLTGTVSALSALPGVVWWHAVGGIASAVYVV